MVLKEVAGVFDAVVVGIPDERFGQRVAAVLAHRPGQEVDLAAVDEHCRSRLAAYKVPRRVVVVDEVVRRPSGKVDLEWAARAASLS